MSQNIIHVKGFTSGISPDDMVVACFRLTELMEQRAKDDKIVLVWDGDKYANDSFTKAIVYCESWNQDVLDIELVCYASKGRKHDVQAIWNTRFPFMHIDVRETDVVVDRTTYNPSEYCAHGHAAMRDTGGTVLFCIGGGACVAQELAGAPPHIRIIIVDAERDGKRLTQQESIAELIKDKTRVEVVSTESEGEA